MIKMVFPYRGHTITLNDKLVECFTSFVDPNITQLLFDMYVQDVFEIKSESISDADLLQYSDEELSKEISDYMIDECKITFKVRGMWEKELEKGEEGNGNFFTVLLGDDDNEV